MFVGQTLVGLAADCRERDFYFSDINGGTISRASLDNSSNSHVIIDGKSLYKYIYYSYRIDLCNSPTCYGFAEI